MDEFVEVSSDIVEFPSTFQNEKQRKLKDFSCETESLPSSTNQETETNQTHPVGTQTEFIRSSLESVDEDKLANWLKKVYPIIEAELLEGVTQLFNGGSDSANTNIAVLPYQNIVHKDASRSGGPSTGAAAWLSVRMNNVPVLVLSSSPVHHGWCEHVDQSLSVYVPKRMPQQEFAVFTEIQKITVKSCIQFLSTNPFNKNMFAGITAGNDLYLWHYMPTSSLEEVQELFCETVGHGSIVGIDWLSVNELLTCHSDGFICLWKISRDFILDKKFKINSNTATTAILAIPPLNFILGLESGQLLLCSSSNSISHSKGNESLDPVILEMEKHSFQVTYLYKALFGSIDVILSCDLSGELFIHDIRNPEDGPTLIVKMSLPFRSSIVCSKDTEYILSPGNETTVEIFRVRNGNESGKSGSSDQKENLIRLSDNGAWLVTGVHNGGFQIFTISEI